MSTRTVADYLALITPFFRAKPKFVATISTSTEPVAELQAVTASIPAAFDLDDAIGVQLDADGEWIGRTRYINLPLANVWFSFDTPGLGFDQGAWKRPFDPDVGIYALDDDTYRLLLRCKIVSNNWDGTVPSAKVAFDAFFTRDGTYAFIEDGLDMSMVFGISGKIPNAMFLAILAGGYIPLKPVGVQAVYLVTSVDEAPLFGFDVDNEYVAGFDVGSWGVPPDYVEGVEPFITIGEASVYIGDLVVTL